jgi:hypothetical protein
MLKGPLLLELEQVFLEFCKFLLIMYMSVPLLLHITM